MGNKQSIECIQIVIDLYNTCIETYLKLQILLEEYSERNILLEAYSKQPNLDPSDKKFYEKHVEITLKNANLEKQFYEDCKNLKNIILDMQTKIIEHETRCELTPLYKVIDIGEISTDKIGIHEKHTKIVDSINKLRQIVGNYKQEIIALKSKFKNKKSIRKSRKKSKSVKVHKSKTIKNKKVKSINKSKKKSKPKRVL